jgi:FecR-like protein
MTAQRLLLSLIAIPLAFGSSLALGAEGGKDGIGFYTAVLGQASVTHPGEARVLPVKLHDEVLFKDVIQTQNESRARALFQDDSMLTVGENSRVEIDEYIYNQDVNVRRAIVKLMQGQVRALVSKVFKANGSRFEIHTPSAVAAARGTYFTVWVKNGQSGIINIGEKGRVDFTSGGMTVAVDPGFFSIAHKGQAPSVPLPHHLGLKDNGESGATVKSAEQTASKPVMSYNQGPKVILPLEEGKLIQASSPDGITQAYAAVERTTLREALLVELPAQVLQALNLDARLMKSLTSLTGLSIESLSGNIGGTATVATSTLTTGALTVGSVSVGSTTVAPLAPVTSALVAPLAPVISPVVAPVAPIISAVVAPVAPIISPVVAPVAPLINTILAIPPAVINGALSLLK